MSVVIHERFSTAEDTAKKLGVPESRARWLVKLLESKALAKANNSERKRAKRNGKVRTRRTNGSKKARARSRATH